ncbi:alpha-(1,3)-fucosyltransferase C-like [Leptidea sinapis]|uniref:alpha-(1,3)-fucosyltransferase C-like n=1 Tax=Leptidea sinapis TaxID=189913 RepID=UPI0021C42886|nr:alpha-(1,3)-fucosyltransferase C-like [Leptidea sinapis]
MDSLFNHQKPQLELDTQHMWLHGWESNPANFSETLRLILLKLANNSADNYPVCDPSYDDFFNWTWTYKYDSTISYRFISIHNVHFEELGSHFQWTTSMKPIDAKTKSLFVNKSKAAAIFLDKCHSTSKREVLLDRLQKELSKFNHSVDIYGDCGDKKCKRRTMNPCFWKLKRTYYFYLAFEDSLADDYITDAVLIGCNNNAVPVVYGGAAYERFLPSGSYLNVHNNTPAQLAYKMNEIILNRELYHDFFRWKNHYIISKTPGLNGCDLCKLLNNPMHRLEKVSYVNFRKWWNPKYEQRCGLNNNIFL